MVVFPSPRMMLLLPKFTTAPLVFVYDDPLLDSTKMMCTYRKPFIKGDLVCASRLHESSIESFN